MGLVMTGEVHHWKPVDDSGSNNALEMECQIHINSVMKRSVSELSVCFIAV